MVGEPVRPGRYDHLDVNGTGQATLSPDGGDWKITLTSVSVTTNIATPAGQRLRERGECAAASSRGRSPGTGMRPTPCTSWLRGEQLIAVWEGGDPGANATLRVVRLAGAAGRVRPGAADAVRMIRSWRAPPWCGSSIPSTPATHPGVTRVEHHADGTAEFAGALSAAPSRCSTRIRATSLGPWMSWANFTARTLTCPMM